MKISTKYMTINYTEKDREYIYSVIVGAVINLLANFILIPRFYAKGAAIATILAE